MAVLQPYLVSLPLSIIFLKWRRISLFLKLLENIEGTFIKTNLPYQNVLGPQQNHLQCLLSFLMKQLAK